MILLSLNPSIFKLALLLSHLSGGLSLLSCALFCIFLGIHLRHRGRHLCSSMAAAIAFSTANTRHKSNMAVGAIKQTSQEILARDPLG